MEDTYITILNLLNIYHCKNIPCDTSQHNYKMKPPIHFNNGNHFSNKSIGEKIAFRFTANAVKFLKCNFSLKTSLLEYENHLCILKY